jgi:hypothetical protein
MAATKILDESHADSISVQAIALLKANFLTVLLAAFVLRLVAKRYASPLRKYPGPALASVSRLWKGTFRVMVCDGGPRERIGKWKLIRAQ